MLRIWLIIILAVVIIYVLFRSRKPRYYDTPSSESAIDILKKRYAKGEISKEEFEKMKTDLRS